MLHNAFATAAIRVSTLLMLCCILPGISRASAHDAARAKMRIQLGVRMPMRDGVQLTADLWMPGQDGKYPAILVRTPYVRTDLETKELATDFWTSHGYVVLAQDVRGRGDSDGEFDFFFQEGNDGYDSVEWIAAQPWSNGRVGMMGVSYMGTVQWLAARAHPPHLVCIAPTAPAGRYFNELRYIGGAFGMGWALPWLHSTSGRVMQTRSIMSMSDELFKHRPLRTIDELTGRQIRLYREFLDHSTLDSYWKRILFTDDDFKRLDIPALTVTGWFDGDQPGALYYWDGMQANSPAKDKQYLVAGPWTHVQTFLGGGLKLGDLNFSADSVLDMKSIHLSFFDRYLKQSTQTLDFPRARVYVTGINKWVTSNQYPLAQSQDRNLYLHGGGKANSLTGDGRLSWDSPDREPADHFKYDPEKPCPMGAGQQDNSGVDQREIERRDDVLVYTSDELKEPLQVVGRVFVNLYAASDSRDTDFTAKLMDVFPDGRALKLCVNPFGVIRARYRNGFEKEDLLTPNQPERFKIWLFDLAHEFAPGHRVRIEISSSAYPLINPNSNTGNPVATDTEWKIANQTVFHDAKMPSYLQLPVVRATDRGQATGRRQ
jgi:putative CocE/NonD family hydrolase